MAIAFVASSNASTANSMTNTSLAIPVPTGTLPGHTLVAWIAIQTPSGVDETLTAPGGWTAIGPGGYDPAGGTGVRLQAFWHRAASGDPANPSWSWPDGAIAVGVMAAYSGVHPTTPVAGTEYGYLPKPDSTSARATPSITTAGSRLVAWAFADRSGSTYSGLSGTQRGTISLASSTSIDVEDSNGEVTGGTIAAKTATASVATSVAVGGIIALQAGSNVAPTVSAGNDQSVLPSTSVTMAATASDSDGTIASYAWTQTGGATVTLTGASTATATFTAPATAGRYTFQVQATDNGGLSATDSVTINVVTSPALPDSDTASSGTWTFGGGASTAYQALNDSSDLTYIQSPGTTGAYREVRLLPLKGGDPTIAVRLASSSEGVAAPVTTELRMGAIVIASWTDNPTTTTPSNYTHTLTSSQLAALTDRTDLRLRFVDA